MRQLGPILLAAAFGALPLSKADAQTAGVDIDWSAPPECAPEEEARRLVEEHLGREFREGDELVAEVTATREEDSYRARVHVTLGERAADRQVRGQSCAAITDAAALILALAIREAPAAPEEPEEPAPANLEPEKPEPIPLRSATPRASLRVAVGALAGGGMLPSTDQGAGVIAGGWLGRWGGEIEGATWREQTARLSMNADIGADIDAWTGALRGCHRRMVSICLGLEGGRISGVGFGYEGERRASHFWAAVTAGAGFDLQLWGALGVFADADAVAPLHRPRFVLGDGTRVFAPSPLGWRVRLGVSVRLYQSKSR